MSSKPKIRDTRRLGLVEVEVDDARHQVAVTMHPPGEKPATVLMSPEDGYGLGKGIVDASYQAQASGAPPPNCPLCGGSLAAEGLPHA